MYDCVMGRRKGNDGAGCILADEMGLGKTLTTVTLVWTLLKQGPRGVPIARKVIICVPSSLVGQWAAEFKKWLKSERIKPIAVDVGGRDATERIEYFVKAPHAAQPVLVISYEMYRKHAAVLNKRPSKIDLLVCDEGHRLKNVDKNATIRALDNVGPQAHAVLGYICGAVVDVVLFIKAVQENRRVDG